MHLNPARRHRATGLAVILAVLGSTLTATAAAGPAAAAAKDPDLGPNVTFIDQSWSVDQINAFLATLNDEPEFSRNRHQVFFEPGVYGSAEGADNPATATGIVNAEIGYYESVAGLGALPSGVVINGALHVESAVRCPEAPWACPDPGSLEKFWRSLSNVAINPIQRPVEDDVDRPFPAGEIGPHQMRWAVSQAAPMRRVDLRGDLILSGRSGEYASGGYLANSRISGKVATGSQQQWFTRNSQVGAWEGGVWNTVFAGVEGAPATDFGPKSDGTTGVTTTLDTAPASREAPFLYRAGDGGLAVFVPRARTDSRGVDWSTAPDSGTSIPIAEFHIAHEGDSAAAINRALRSGKNLLLTPGVYKLDRALRVSRPGTVVLGLGYASLTPTRGRAALEIADIPGVAVAGVTVDAGTVPSDVLVRVGGGRPGTSDPADPTTLTDVFVRVGGPWSGNAKTSVEILSDHVLLDHLWLWRGDHGLGETGTWAGSRGDHGLVVRGDDVTATGLFVEHYQKNQVVWEGERGRTIFYQSELPYEVPSQEAWSDGERPGYASYRVADAVTQHEAVGLGVYSYFNQGVDIRVASGIQAPLRPQVRFRSMTSVFLNGHGGIEHVINDTGAAAVGSFAAPQVVSYPTTQRLAAPVTTNARCTAIARSRHAVENDGVACTG
jgi:hypothetical protein